jgi:hypothetical protein
MVIARKHPLNIRREWRTVGEERKDSKGLPLPSKSASKEVRSAVTGGVPIASNSFPSTGPLALSSPRTSAESLVWSIMTFARCREAQSELEGEDVVTTLPETHDVFHGVFHGQCVQRARPSIDEYFPLPIFGSWGRER